MIPNPEYTVGTLTFSRDPSGQLQVGFGGELINLFSCPDGVLFNDFAESGYDGVERIEIKTLGTSRRSVHYVAIHREALGGKRIIHEYIIDPGEHHCFRNDNKMEMLDPGEIEDALADQQRNRPPDLLDWHKHPVIATIVIILIVLFLIFLLVPS